MIKNRFNVSKEELSSYIQDAIMWIELGTNLKFKRAEDWTMENQGHVLHFEGDLYNEGETWDDIIKYLKMQFAYNPTTKCIEEDTSDFEELAFENDEWLIYIAI